jgi:hypothetical protein
MTSRVLELLSQSKNIIRQLLRKVDRMGSEIQMTAQSTVYRKRAQSLGRAADLEEDHELLMVLVREALSWIQLAENEEALAFLPKDQ